ncbi:hypothetical protein SAMN04489713_13063 [Actinomadura madurae]|uniref:Uncharacterized protein n=1 Tax=Actinomadura madurae TaxID=1993 RepID=A0A1I5Y8U5_9ACTN|nr:hypothetical protein [Actinomadura madurae]SFQ40337.1 hypothetical protein SAMN04489713_13063 [Actinomadura madurae]
MIFRVIGPHGHPLCDLASRYTRTRGPFRAGELAARFGLGIAVIVETLPRPAARGPRPGDGSSTASSYRSRPRRAH